MTIHDEYTKMPISKSKKWKLRHPEKNAKITKDYYPKQKELDILRKFGLTKNDVKIMKEAQNNKCAICGHILSRPCIDHDHKTGKVRGLLCRRCNRALGMFYDDVLVLEKAINYLK